ncbi:hypothetical protein K2173_018100 [Erythroxylum novogranatense]|uniref:Uncharacterized protein n=1 Tax=Erythroxylum novogranatense TaxID=1862640 RepID=A0AAV8U7H2_9ROSI|nr:hypothetical protein K2173_018100 [Erythroxylum novogranatense]
MGHVDRNSKTDASIYPLLIEEEDADVHSQICEGTSTDGKAFLWLSSDCSSTSTFFQEHGLSTSLHLSVDKWLISWLSTLADSYLHLDKASSLSQDKSRCYPGEEASFALERTSADSSAISSKSFISSCEQSSEEMTVSENSLTHDNPSFDCSSSSEISDMERSILVSLVTLEGEGSKGNSDKDLDLGYFKFGCSKESWLSDVSPSSSQTSSRFSEVTDEYPPHETLVKLASIGPAYFEGSDNDEPLFWPFEQKTCWNSKDSGELFSMSPRRDTIKLTIPPGPSSKHVGSKSCADRKDFKVNCGRRMVFNSSPAAPTPLERRRQNNNHGINKKTSSVSRSRFSTEVKPLKMKDAAKVGKKEVAIRF